ncbi:MAG: glycosyltransferase [Deltaproteobacteria bacterium]|nr:MAG: glycosyltransferase [Deltaproteobacteria bacterium]
MDVQTWLLVLYVALHTPLCVYGLHRAWLQLVALGPAPEDPVVPITSPPRVTVQLPFFNERDVAERAIDAVGSLDWPLDALQIQVLDDSTDDTTERAEWACRALRERGLDAQVHHRSERAGFKAGALAAGLSECTGDFVAIFDADFIPPKDFLRRTIPYLLGGADMVQARWGHLNEDSGLLTRLQAILLDGHFAVEQVARHRAGHWFQFNGTAGIWRRSAIDGAGGWQTDTLTEDLDLSYRAQLAGSRFVYLDELVAPAELPADMISFKAQQHRWAKGMAQALRKSGGRVIRAEAPLATRLEAILHLTSACAWPLVALISVLLPLVVLGRGLGWLWVPPVVDLAILATATFAIATFYAVAAARADRAGLAKRLGLIPLAMALGVGLSLAQTAAVIQGLFGGTGVFERTPKAGAAGRSSYRARVRPVVLFEVAMALWLSCASIFSLVFGLPSAAPFLALLASGYALVGVGGLMAWRRRHHSSAPIPSNAGGQVKNHSQTGSDQAPLSAS